MIDAGVLQDVRQIVLYPVLTVAGLVWVVGFWLRWRHTHCTGDRWAMASGAALLWMGASGTAALLMASATGFSVSTAAVFTVGLGVVAAVAAAGALRLFVGAWRVARRDVDGMGHQRIGNE